MDQRNLKVIDVSRNGTEPKRRLFARAPGCLFDVRAGAGATEVLIYDEIGAHGVSADTLA
jgi:hypothetical protein